jgi:predicted DNA-binding protein with PD1-like motif
MKTYISEKFGRFVIINLHKGEKVLESISQEIKRLSIKNGVILSGIGSMRQVSYHIIKSTTDDPVNEFGKVQNPIELGGIQGLIIDGEPHLHVIASDPERAYIGHLEDECEVQYLAEIAILEIIDMDLTREMDEFGIQHIQKNKM